MLRASVLRAVRLRDLVSGCRADLPATLPEARNPLGELETYLQHAAGWLAKMEDAWESSAG